MIDDGRIGRVPYDPAYPVSTAWDLGHDDQTVIVFFQIVKNNMINVIDCYANNNQPIGHYIKYIKGLEYVYGKHFAPHDIDVHDYSTGLTRLEYARQLGLNFETREIKGKLGSATPKKSIIDGIEAVRVAFSRMAIDQTKCAKLIKALESYHREWDDEKKKYSDTMVHDWSSDYCFTGDTLVLTRHGMRQIMLIEENDEVLTLEGWKPCTKAFKTRTNAKLVEVTFTDGTIVRCTPEHLFLTTNEWRSASDLMSNSKIRSSLTSLLNTLMEYCIVYGRIRSIFLAATEDYIEQSGKMLLEQYQAIATFTIKTLIPITTISGISNVYQKQSIEKFLDHITKDCLMLLGKEQDNGISPMLEDYGINDMLKNIKFGRSGNAEKCSAFSVNQSLAVLYEEMGTHKNFVTQTAKACTIAKIRELKTREDVYDISVPGVRHFSLSNGAIVHNCDAVRYMALTLDLHTQGMTVEDVHRGYNQAMFSNSQQLDYPFTNDRPNYSNHRGF